MHSRTTKAVSASAVAIACAASLALAGTATATRHTLTVAHQASSGQVSSAGVAKTCYTQRDNDKIDGVGIVSQNFEATFDAYDAAGADDFKLKSCKAKSFTADGIYFNGSGPADSFDVVYYKGTSAPGAIFKACTGASYTDGGFGTPTVTCKAKLTKKAKWASIVANLAFSAGGEWGWNTNQTQRGKGAMWQNPGNGFATGCTSWGNMVTCLGALGQGPDFSFSIN